MGATFSELRDTNPLFYGILLVIAAFSIQVLTPILLVLAASLQVAVAGDDLYITIVARALGLFYFAWLFITPLWLAGLMRQQSVLPG